MSGVSVPAAVPLTTIHGVELCALGEWNNGTISFTFTATDLADMVGALDCPGVRNAVIKLGHDEPDGPGVRWDGEPALGWVANLRIDGAKLIGDLTGIPSWLAEVLPSAYPDRSVEVAFDFVCQIGHTHPRVLTALALLGVAQPAVGVLRSLQDVAALYQASAPAPRATIRASVSHGGTVYLASFAVPRTTTLRRRPTSVEAAARTDFLAVQGQWEDALDAELSRWAAPLRAAQADLVDQVEAAVAAGDLDGLTKLAVDSTPVAELLDAAMRDLAGEAADEMVREAGRQGVTVVEPRLPDGRLGEIAAVTTALMMASLATTAGRRAVQLAAPGITAATVAAGVADHLAGLSDRWVADQLGAALSAAQNTGRLAVLDAAPAASYYASEILDNATCDPCAQIDGTQFDDLDAAQAAYVNGGYIDCDGGLRCRGIVVTVWDTASPVAASRVLATVPFALRMEGTHAHDPSIHFR